MITQAMPGKLLVLRNVGNIVPPCQTGSERNSVVSALEFAVLGLKISEIIVCGHSDCGAMKVLDGLLETKNMPHLSDWLKSARPAKERADAVCLYGPEKDRSELIEKENILVQLENICTYPFVKRALEEGSLHLHGWYYHIGKGDVEAYDFASKQFEKI